MFLVASLRHEEDGIFQFPFHLERHDNLFRSRVETLSDFRYGSNQKFLVTLHQLALILVGKALVDGAVFHVNIVDEGILHGVIMELLMCDSELVHQVIGDQNRAARTFARIKHQAIDNGDVLHLLMRDILKHFSVPLRGYDLHGQLVLHFRVIGKI